MKSHLCLELIYLQKIIKDFNFKDKNKNYILNDFKPF